MRKKEVLAHFGSVKAVAAALSVTRCAVGQWGEIVPEKRALILHLKTNGALQYEPELYTKVVNRLSVAKIELEWLKKRRIPLTSNSTYSQLSLVDFLDERIKAVETELGQFDKGGGN